MFFNVLSKPFITASSVPQTRVVVWERGKISARLSLTVRSADGRRTWRHKVHYYCGTARVTPPRLADDVMPVVVVGRSAGRSVICRCVVANNMRITFLSIVRGGSG